MDMTILLGTVCKDLKNLHEMHTECRIGDPMEIESLKYCDAKLEQCNMS